ncbi:MAG TPA: GNAT family N-acetyltransferase [Acidimicrobiales bacterium]|nr:GNAT family N-acetyltransferase [Acidimicrobiales bacterium]
MGEQARTATPLGAHGGVDGRGRARVRLLAAGAAHAEGTRAIYNKAIETSTATFEMTPKSLQDQLAWIAEHSGAYPAIVALADDDEVVGFGSLSPYRPRPAYSTTVENSVYVHDDHHRKGIGRAILVELERLAQAHGFHAIIARISADNDASIALHTACGFEMIGVEREVGRKFGRWLDVACMQRLV